MGALGRQADRLAGAVAQLVDVALDCGEDFRDAYDQGADTSPIRQLLHGLDTGGDLADAQDALDRRMFAMPYFGTRIGEEDYPRLDPGDPDERRRLLIEGEHPDYHAVADPAFDGEIDGVNSSAAHRHPRGRRHPAVGGRPSPEAWRAAKRLHDVGVDRHDILHQLGSVVTDHLHGALTNRQAVDPVAYRQALDALRPPFVPAAAVAPVRDALCQVKITLRGAKPRSGGGYACPLQPPWRSCTRSSRWRSAGRTPTCMRSRSAVAATPDPTSSCGTRPPTKARPGCAT